ncbi:MAG: DUF4124 domain-containing protein [Pseudomonadota bacterium]
MQTAVLAMRNLTVLFLVLFLATAGAQTIYKHVDEDGNVTFSDEPMSEDAVEVDLPAISVISTQQQAPAEVLAPEAPSEPEVLQPVYQRLQITRPRQEQTLFAAEGPVRVSVALDRPLQDGHQYRVFIDGDLRAEGREATFTIDPVYRGEHTLTAQVVDETGRTLTTSEPVTFFRRQPTVSQPRVRPRGP